MSDVFTAVWTAPTDKTVSSQCSIIWKCIHRWRRPLSSPWAVRCYPTSTFFFFCIRGSQLGPWIVHTDVWLWAYLISMNDHMKKKCISPKKINNWNEDLLCGRSLSSVAQSSLNSFNDLNTSKAAVHRPLHVACIRLCRATHLSAQMDSGRSCGTSVCTVHSCCFCSCLHVPPSITLYSSSCLEFCFFCGMWSAQNMGRSGSKTTVWNGVSEAVIPTKAQWRKHIETIIATNLISNLNIMK